MNDGRAELLVIVVLLSIAAHVGLMCYARSRVMTQVVPSSVRAVRREAMRVARHEPPPEAVKLEAVPDVDAPKDAPAADQTVSRALESIVEDARLSPSVEVVEPVVPSEAPREEAAAVFDVKPLSVAAETHPEALPLMHAEGPKAGVVADAPKDDKVIRSLALSPALDVKAPAVGAGDAPVLGPVRMETAGEKPESEFLPAEEVFEKVDEKVVEAEKQAVQELMNAVDALEVTPFVELKLLAAKEGEWTYFNVQFSPRQELSVVPKDLVVLIDASGSIGAERIRSVREAAKRVLRSALNSGDRFNLVAFRDRYSYAFRTWQECRQSSFDQADKWLGEVTAHGRTDVFATISSVLTLPRTPERPLVAMVITDGDANVGVWRNTEILSKFTALNGGLVSVYMYGVKSSANRELIDVLTTGNRGESQIYDGWAKWRAGQAIESFTERFRDPVLSDLRVIFATGSKAECYPTRLRNLYRGRVLSLLGRVPSTTDKISFSLRGLNGKDAYEGFFELPVAAASSDPSLVGQWKAAHALEQKLK